MVSRRVLAAPPGILPALTNCRTGCRHRRLCRFRLRVRSGALGLHHGVNLLAANRGPLAPSNDQRSPALIGHGYSLVPPSNQRRSQCRLEEAPFAQSDTCTRPIMTGTSTREGRLPSRMPAATRCRIRRSPPLALVRQGPNWQDARDRSLATGSRGMVVLLVSWGAGWVQEGFWEGAIRPLLRHPRLSSSRVERPRGTYTGSRRRGSCRSARGPRARWRRGRSRVGWRRRGASRSRPR